MYTYKLPVLIIVFVCVLGLTQTFGETQSQTIRVGIFQNNPLSFIDERGQAQGIYPDLIKEIARKQGWTIDFILDSWSGCLNRLESGTIDLMISIVRSKDREKIYDFSTLPVVTAWGQVYARKEHTISNILDLDDKTLGIMAKDINGKNLQDLTRKFKIDAEFSAFPVYDNLCQALTKNQVDAVVINNVNGAFFQKKYDLHPTPVLFSPIDAYFAVSKGKNRHILSSIDTQLALWKQDKTSVYYSILSRWYGNIGTYHGPSLMLILGIAALIVGISLFLFIWNRLLKHQINQHTKDLKKSEEKYRTLSQKALVGIYQITRDGQLILANQRMADIFGYSSSQELSKAINHISALFKNPDQVDPLLSEIDQNGSVQGKLMEFISKESRQIWGNLHIRRTSTDEGDPIYEGFMEDVSQRHRHDQVLRASENRYRRFVETAIEGIWALDTNFCITFVNAMLAKMLGYTQEEMIGKKAETFIFPQDLAAHHARVTNCTKGSHQQHESRFRKKDGSEYWVIVSASAIHTQDGEFDGAFAMFTDITDRKAAEEKLKQTQKRFLAILDGIESTIYVADMKTHEILFMNDYMKQLFGADLTGDICWKAFRNQDKPCAHCTNQFLVTPEEIPTGIHLWEDKHPVTGRWNIYHDRAIKWVDGRIARLQIATDVSKLKEMELCQREYEVKIQQAQKMEALGALASGIAHDFNNILFPILGYAEMLKDEVPEDSPYKSSLKEILTGAGRARDLVEQILTFSRQADQKTTPLRPDLIVKEVIKLMRATLPSTIRIDKYIDPKCKRVMADPTQLHQVAMNLITNAFHAMEVLGGTLTIQLKNAEKQGNNLLGPGHYVHFSVKDTGVGMDSQTIEKIFDPYFTTKPKGKGTGMGLSVVHGIIKKYKGEILVNSSPGKGTQFDIFLPAVTRASIQADKATLPTNLAGGAERILIVDDEPQVLNLEKDILERFGYAVTTQKSSKKALELVAAGPDLFDLIITDMTMPEMTGDLLTREILKIAPQMPVIICTGFSERINRERALDLGIKSVLIKPVSKSDLASAVRSALDGME